jgi:aspartate 1-decarboxylase
MYITMFINNFHKYFQKLEYSPARLVSLTLPSTTCHKPIRPAPCSLLTASSSLLCAPFLPAPKAVLRTLLKSKLHRAHVTDANIQYEGSITIPTDLMEAADLWDGEKVLVTSITNGARLETYVIPGPAGSGQIVVNGAAAHLINTGHRVTIMAWAQSDQPVKPKRLLLDEQNKVVNQTVL